MIGQVTCDEYMSCQYFPDSSSKKSYPSGLFHANAPFFHKIYCYSLTVSYLGVPRPTQAELTPIIISNLKYDNHRLRSRCAGQECDSADIENGCAGFERARAELEHACAELECGGCAELALTLRDVEWS
jgi:hypothetical protein